MRVFYWANHHLRGVKGTKREMDLKKSFRLFPDYSLIIQVDYSYTARAGLTTLSRAASRLRNIEPSPLQAQPGRAIRISRYRRKRMPTKISRK